MKIDIKKFNENFIKVGALSKVLSLQDIYNAYFSESGYLKSSESDLTNSEFELKLFKQLVLTDEKIKGKFSQIKYSDLENLEYKLIDKISVPKEIIYSKIVSKDSLRPNIIGVYYENGYVVATDDYKLIALKQDYDKNLEGKIINKNGFVIDLEYPDWKRVVPNLDGVEKITYDVDYLIIQLQTISNIYKIAGLGIKYLLFKDDKHETCIDPDIMLPIILQAKKMGIDRLDLYFVGSGRAVVIKDDYDKLLGLVMPISIGVDEVHFKI